MQPTPEDVAWFLGQGNDLAVESLAQQHLPFVASTVKAYTRGRGYTNGEPNDDVALVIIASCARMVNNPKMNKATSRTSGPYQESITPTAFLGWTLPELAILHRYRRRAA